MPMHILILLMGLSALLFKLVTPPEAISESPESVAEQLRDKTEKLQWLTLDEAEAEMALQKKDIIIDLYTDWCGWCKVMDKNTYTHKQVIDYVQHNFYPVKINAETRDMITWRGRQFKYNDAYRVNDFAILLTGGRLSYPSTVIIPADGSTPQAVPGYLKPADMELILKYFGEGHFGKTPFQDYQKNFKQTWK